MSILLPRLLSARILFALCLGALGLALWSIPAAAAATQAVQKAPIVQRAPHSKVARRLSVSVVPGRLPSQQTASSFSMLAALVGTLALGLAAVAGATSVVRRRRI